tara:strand:- start:378 stop:1421 length:1044 start_codon:yes stop_codon:yes gene_type:complete
MLINLEIKKSSASTWLLALFSFIILLTGIYSDFFQAPTELTPEMSNYQSLFKPGQILGVQQIILKNNLGTFHFEKTTQLPDTNWQMISPRSLPANTTLIKNILNDLNKVKIRNVHEMDAINISNYSLDNTSIEVTLIGSDEKSATLKFGLVNPLDNSTYVSLSDQQAIYHIDNIGMSLNTLNLGSFVDTRIFTFNPSEVNHLTIYKGTKERGSVRFEIHKDNKTKSWSGRYSKNLKNEAVLDYLSNLADLRSPLILDKINKDLEKEIENYFEKPTYEVEIKTSSYTYTYQISPLVKSLGDIKLEKWQNFMIKASNRNHAVVVSRKFLGLFNPNEKSLRSFPVKKLFY